MFFFLPNQYFITLNVKVKGFLVTFLQSFSRIPDSLPTCIQQLHDIYNSNRNRTNYAVQCFKYSSLAIKKTDD